MPCGILFVFGFCMAIIGFGVGMAVGYERGYHEGFLNGGQEWPATGIECESDCTDCPEKRGVE